MKFCGILVVGIIIGVLIISGGTVSALSYYLGSYNSSLVFHDQFNQTSDLTTASTGQTLTNTGSVTISSSNPPPFGAGSAVFSGSNYVSSPASSTFRFPGNLTILIWMKGSSTSGSANGPLSVNVVNTDTDAARFITLRLNYGRTV